MSWYIEKHLLFSTLVTNCQFHRLLDRFSVFVPRLYDPASSISFTCKMHSVSQQNMPSQTQHWELQNISKENRVF